MSPTPPPMRPSADAEQTGDESADAGKALLPVVGPKHQSTASEPKRPPAGWSEIKVGDLVLAKDARGSDGWFEAHVIEQLGDDQFRLRFRDYPEEGTVVRRRDQLALLPPV